MNARAISEQTKEVMKMGCKRDGEYDRMQKDVSGEAARRFIHKAYTSYGVAEYMARKYDIKKEHDAGGQTNTD